MVTTVEKHDPMAILARAIDPENGNWSGDLAKAILSISVAATDRDRMHALAKLAQAGELSPQQESEIDNYRLATGILDILKAKAQVSLLHRR